MKLLHRLFLLTILLTLPAVASSLTTTSSASANLTVCDPNIPSCIPVAGSQSANGTSSTTLDYVAFGAVPGSSSDAFGRAEVTTAANASFGTLFASVGISELVSYTFPPFPPLQPYGSGSAGGSASASFADTLTIFGGTGQGTLVWGVSNGCLVGCSFSTTLPTTFTFGQPFDISAVLTVSDFIALSEGFDLASGRISVRLVDIRGSGGSALTGYEWLTNSATDYGFTNGVVATPEPGTWTAGVAVLLGWWLRRSRRTL